MKIESSFQPLNFWAQGPWMFFNIGLKFMQTWQNECFARLRLMPSSARPTAGAAAVAGIAAAQGRATPMFGCMQSAIVVGGPADEKPVKAAPVAAKVAPVAKAAPAKVAAPKVVAPKAAVVPAPVVAAVEAVVAEDAPLAEASAPSVTSMLAMQAKSLAKAVKTAPPPVVANKSAKKPAAKAEAPVVAAVAKPAAKAAAKVATAAVKPAAKAVAASKAAPAASKKA